MIIKVKHLKRIFCLLKWSSTDAFTLSNELPRMRPEFAAYIQENAMLEVCTL